MKDKDEGDGKKSSHAWMMPLLSLVFFGAAVWWSFARGSRCPSILKGYEQVADHDKAYLMNEFSTLTNIP